MAEKSENKLIFQIAPAIRALFTDKGCVCFEKDPRGKLRPNGLNFEVIHTGDIEDIYTELVKLKGKKLDIIGIGGLGWFCIGQSKPEADNTRRSLKGEACKKIKNPSGRVSNRIFVITGSAQGFGEGISLEMAAEGANIIVADINYELAVKKAAVLNDTYGEGTALAVKVDITDEDSVEAMLEEVILEYGGLDVFISNAGISHAGGLEQISFDFFEKMTRINYTAFFICTKYASRILKIEHKFNPAFTSDIIQINSKSGLDGSINNFTYAGGKFGGIGLVQSFAKELVADGIKVNAICPGNFFDGPMWSDPQKGLFVQYLEVGKVPGAKTIEDVRKYHMDKIPMKRGCVPKDVARAVFYCIEQQYETGQAIPVAGGQVMLK